MLDRNLDTNGSSSSVITSPDVGISSVPAEKLEALLQASDEMMEAIFRRDRQSALKTIVRATHDLLEAEACAIFLVPENSPKELVLEEAYTDKGYNNPPKERLTIQSTPKGGLTAHLADKGAIARFNNKELAENRYVAGKPADYLSSKKCFSLLAIPLKDRKGNTLGIVKVDNKKNEFRKACETVTFSAVDEYIARILANKISLVLSNIRRFEVFRELMQTAHEASSEKVLFDVILQTGLSLVGADRGDLLLWNEQKNALVHWPSPGSIRGGYILREPSLSHKAFAGGQTILCEDISQDPAYKAIDGRTKSEIVVPLKYEGRKIGVLNAESFRLKGFDTQDQELLEALAQYAAIALQAIGKQYQFQNIVEQLAKHSPPQSVLTSIIDSVLALFSLAGGIIYIVDEKNRILRCSAYASRKELSIKDPTQFSYRFDEDSLATHVFHTKKEYKCSNPLIDPIVNKKGLEAFDIKDSIIGMPLIFRDKVVGVLATWFGGYAGSLMGFSSSTLENINLTPFARVAATTIALASAELRRETVFQELKALLSSLHTELSLEKSLSLILRGIQLIGFDRGRVYKFDEKQEVFIGLDCLGMTDPEKFRDWPTSLTTNPYAKHLVDTFLENSKARIYDPKGPLAFGPDPYHDFLEKPLNLPWAAVPLVIGGKLYGQITADNALNPRAITLDCLDYLALLGALAAQAIANSQTKEQFFTNAFHNLRTPTHSIAEIAKKLISKNSLSMTDQQEWLVLLNEQAQQLSQLVKRVNSWTLFQKKPLSKEQTSLKQIVEKSIRTFRIAADEKNVEIETETPTDTCEIIADEMRLQEALQNLIENAVKFSQPGHTIWVQLSITSTAYRVSVTDEGPGVPNDQREMIFQELVSISRNNVPESSGLGLPMTRATIEAHGGLLTCESGPNNRGACFCFTLPRRADEVPTNGG
jgi:signal transduction histidine kinase